MNKTITGKNSGYEEQFAAAPMLPLMMKMAIPAVAAQLVNLLYSIIDRVYIGHIKDIGMTALAGVGVCSTIIILVSAFAQIVGSGAAPLASIALGKGDKKQASRFLNNGFFMILVFTILLMTIVFLRLEPILRMVGASDTTLPYAAGYLKIYMLGTFFVLVSLGLNPFLNVQGKPKSAMLSVLIGAGLNILLDPLFMFVLKMGVSGAAVATVLSQGVSAVFILHFLLSNNTELRLRKQDMRPDIHVLRETFSLGIAPFVMASTESLIGFVLNRSLAFYGDIYVGALTVMQSAMQFINVPLQGFSQGGNPIISFNYGRGDRKRLVSGFFVMMAVMFSVNFVIVVLMLLFPAGVAGLFTDNRELIVVVKHSMPLFLTGMSIFGLQRACQNMFISMNQAKTALFIALLRKVILLVPLALILPHLFQLGVKGVYLAESIADGTAAILCTMIFAYRFPRILNQKA